MGWPVDARLYQFQDDNPPGYDAAWGNEIQDQIIGLRGGGLTVKKIKVDNQGGQAATYGTGEIAFVTGGALRVDGATGDEFPALRTEAVPVDGFKLLWEANCDGAYARLYSRLTPQGLVATTNAAWNPNDSKWYRDTAADSSLVVLSTLDSPYFNCYAYLSGSSDGWLTAAWTDYGGWTRVSSTPTWAVQGNLYASGDAVIVGKASLSATRSSGTVGAGQSLTIGEAYKDTLPIAWGSFRCNGSGSITFTRGVNISSCSRTGTGEFTVTLVNGASNAAVVNVQFGGDNATSSASAYRAIVTPRVITNTFKIQIISGDAGAASDGLDSTVQIHFTVYGG